MTTWWNYRRSSVFHDNLGFVNDFRGQQIEIETILCDFVAVSSITLLPYTLSPATWTADAIATIDATINGRYDN